MKQNIRRSENHDHGCHYGKAGREELRPDLPAQLYRETKYALLPTCTYGSEQNNSGIFTQTTENTAKHYSNNPQRMKSTPRSQCNKHMKKYSVIVLLRSKPYVNEYRAVCLLQTLSVLKNQRKAIILSQNFNRRSKVSARRWSSNKRTVSFCDSLFHDLQQSLQFILLRFSKAFYLLVL